MHPRASLRSAINTAFPLRRSMRIAAAQTADKAQTHPPPNLTQASQTNDAPSREPPQYADFESQTDTARPTDVQLDDDDDEDYEMFNMQEQIHLPIASPPVQIIPPANPNPLPMAQTPPLSSSDTETPVPDSPLDISDPALEFSSLSSNDPADEDPRATLNLTQIPILTVQMSDETIALNTPLPNDDFQMEVDTPIAPATAKPDMPTAEETYADELYATDPRATLNLHQVQTDQLPDESSATDPRTTLNLLEPQPEQLVNPYQLYMHPISSSSATSSDENYADHPYMHAFDDTIRSLQDDDSYIWDNTQACTLQATIHTFHEPPTQMQERQVSQAKQPDTDLPTPGPSTGAIPKRTKAPNIADRTRAKSAPPPRVIAPPPSHRQGASDYSSDTSIEHAATGQKRRHIKIRRVPAKMRAISGDAKLERH